MLASVLSYIENSNSVLTPKKSDHLYKARYFLNSDSRVF